MEEKDIVELINNVIAKAIEEHEEKCHKEEEQELTRLGAFIIGGVCMGLLIIIILTLQGAL